MTNETLLLEAPAYADTTALEPEFSRGRSRPPLLTIAIPAYNRPELLREALASVARQRDFKDFEVVVCDDGGLPETQQVVKNAALPNIRFYINRPSLGAIGNWNRCVRLAAGRWVTLLHEDDLLYPWFLATVAPRLRSQIVAVAARCTQAAEPPALVPSVRPPTSRVYRPAWFLKSSMTPFPGVVFSRTLALRLGGFDPKYGGLADYVFWYELACAGQVEMVRETAAFYRVNRGQWTDREWPAMLRGAHLLRLRIAREQFPAHSRLGRWLARFYSGRMARSYSRRFPERPADLGRARRFERIPFGWLSSGWVWRLLQALPRFTPETRRSSLPHPLSPQTGRP